MANKKIKMLGLVLATLVILFITSVIGYFIATQIAVSNSKKSGKPIDYLPEKIVKLETEFKSKSGVHFLGKSGKLYRCNEGNKTCKATEKTPPKYEDKTPFVATDSLYPKFSNPPVKVKQYIILKGRGLFSHITAKQYALLEDGRVWSWHYSGNEMGDSFPFWHLENISFLLLGVVGGLVVGLIISVTLWILMLKKFW